MPRRCGRAPWRRGAPRPYVVHIGLTPHRGGGFSRENWEFETHRPYRRLVATVPRVSRPGLAAINRAVTAAILADRPARQRRTLISPSTVRRSRSPKMCWCTVWLNTLLTFTVVVMAPLRHFTPKLPFTVAYPSV